MKKRKFGSVDELLEQAFLGVIKRRKLIKEKSLKELFEEIGIFEEGDKATCWECWGKTILSGLEKKGLVAVSEDRFFSLTPKGCDVFVPKKKKEQEMRDEE